MISVDGLAVEFGGTTLFKDISFQINEKDRIALMGKNGAGKSTLLKILAGVRQPTRGKVSAPKDCVIAYLPQHLMTEDGRTVFEETSQAFAHLHEAEAEIERMNNELATRTDYESDEYMALIEQVAVLSEKFYAIDMTHFEEDVEKTLLGLGFERTDFSKPTSEFSGGWRMRIELAKMLLRNPDVLLLDEPTNHLDMRSKDVLKEAIREFDGTVILVSHDREFLDGLVSKVYEFGDGKVKEHLGGIYDFLQSKGGVASPDSARSLDSVMTATKSAQSTSKDPNEKIVGGGAADYAARKEQAKAQRKLQKRVEECEKRVTQIEAELRELEEWMATPTGAANAALFEQYSKLKNTLAEAEAEWEEAMMALEG